MYNFSTAQRTRQGRRPSVRAAILAYLAAHSPAHATVIAWHLRTSPQDVRTNCTFLVHQQRVRRVAPGTFALVTEDAHG